MTGGKNEEEHPWTFVELRGWRRARVPPPQTRGAQGVARRTSRFVSAQRRGAIAWRRRGTTTPVP